jgi:flagellar motor switch protein FliG
MALALFPPVNAFLTERIRAMPEAVQAEFDAKSAAMLLVSLGEADAASVLKHLDPRVVQRVGAEMAQLSNISRDQISGVLGGFFTAVGDQVGGEMGSDDFVRRVLFSALGNDKANGIIDRIALGRSSRGLEALKWMDARAIHEMIKNEHPQIVAIVLAYLEPDQSAGVLAAFPKTMQADLVMRVATLDGVQPDALSKLDEVLERQSSGQTSGRASNLGGTKAASALLNMVEGGSDGPVMEQIRKADEPLAQRLQELMFVFENLLDVDDRGIQELLRNVPSDKLPLALKGADDVIKTKFFKNMSERAAEMLRDDMESRGPVRLADVEAAQKEIVGIARRMADEGALMLGTGGEQMV